MTFEEAIKRKKQERILKGEEDGKKFRIMVIPSDFEFDRKYFDFYAQDSDNIKDEAAITFSKDKNYRVAKIWMNGPVPEYQVLANPIN